MDRVPFIHLCLQLRWLLLRWIGCHQCWPTSANMCLLHGRLWLYIIAGALVYQPVYCWYWLSPSFCTGKSGGGGSSRPSPGAAAIGSLRGPWWLRGSFRFPYLFSVSLLSVYQIPEVFPIWYRSVVFIWRYQNCLSASPSIFDVFFKKRLWYVNWQLYVDMVRYVNKLLGFFEFWRALVLN